MSNLSALTRLFFWHCKLNVSRSMAYRADFLSSVVISLLFSGIAPLTQFLLFTQTRGFPGWTLDQILLFQGILLLSAGIRGTCFGSVRETVTALVRKGDFDRLLLKPYPPIGVLLTGGFSFSNIGTLLAGLALTVVAMARLQLGFHPLQLLAFLLLFLNGVLFYMAFLVMFCSIVITIIQIFRIGDLIDNLLKFGEYPMELFTGFTKIALMVAVPFSLMTYMPAQALLGRMDVLFIAGSAVSVLLFAASLKFWKWRLHHYTSAGG